MRRRGGHRAPVRLSSLAAGGLVAWSAFWVGLAPGVLVAGDVIARAGEVIAGAVPPTLPEGGWSELVSLALETLAMSVLAGVFAFAGAIALAFPASRPHGGGGRWIVSLAARAALLALRAVPPPVWALVVLFVLYPGVWPGAIALGLYNLGVVGRLMAEAAENLDPAPAQALRSAGAGGAHAFLYATAPAALGRFAAYGLYRWEVAMRETLVVGAVGAGGLGLALQHQLARFDFGAAVATVLATIVLTFAVDLVSAALRRSLADARRDGPRS